MRSQPIATRAGIASGYQGRDPETAARQVTLPWSHADERLAAAKSYWVVTTGTDGRPHPRPLWGLWLDGSLLFTVLRSTRTARNLAANPYATAHLESAEDVTIIDGEVTEVPLANLERFLVAWLEKYAQHGATAGDDAGDLDRVIYQLRPRRAHGWTLDAFPSDLTRWDFPS